MPERLVEPRRGTSLFRLQQSVHHSVSGELLVSKAINYELTANIVSRFAICCDSTLMTEEEYQVLSVRHSTLPVVIFCACVCCVTGRQWRPAHVSRLPNRRLEPCGHQLAGPHRMRGELAWPGAALLTSSILSQLGHIQHGRLQEMMLFYALE